MTLGTTMAVGALLCSCAPELPPTSSPTPVVTPTPSASTPTESPQEREERLAYEGAEKAYRAFSTEYFRVVSASDQPRITKRMRQTADGPLLRAYAGILRTRRVQHIQSSGKTGIGYVNRIAYAPSRVELKVCEDRSDVTLFKRGRKAGRGNVTTTEITVRLVKSQWKLWQGDNQKSVKSCAEQ